MLARLLGLKDAESVNYFFWHLRHPWPGAVAIALVLCAAAYAIWLYRGEIGLSRARRVSMAVLRTLVLGTVILMLFEPAFALEATVRLRRVVLVLLDRSDSMRQTEVRQRREDLADAAIALGKIAPEAYATAVLDPHRREIDSATRLDMARRLLANADLKILERLGKNNTVRLFTFNQELDPISGEGAMEIPDTQRQRAFDRVTALGSAVHEAVQRYAGQPIAAVVVISDGASNAGLEPLEVARRMKERGVPIYTIGIGVADPPDVRIADVIAQETVFAQDRVPVTVRLESSGYDRQQARLSLALDGQEIEGQSRTVTLTGGTQYEEFTFTAGTRTGRMKLSATISPMAGEASADNNVFERPIEVTDQKIKVLYVEGKPRWEYRYLRAVLLRDPRLDVRFLMTQGDSDLARYSPIYIDRFPDDASAFAFDMIIIGDVPCTYFTPDQVERIRRLVQDQGGSLLMLAGRRFAPATYAGTTLGALLPVEATRDAPITVNNDAHPVITSVGQASAAVALETLADDNNQVWSMVRPLYQLPAIKAIKPGAIVLAELSEAVGLLREKYPLVAWHRVGSGGKVMYVATDQLWRLRFKTGDKYHARFWSQTIQFMSLSRLLGGNKRVNIQIDKRRYQPGDQVRIFARVLTQAYEPAIGPQYEINLERLDGERETRRVRLESVPDSPGVYQGYVTADRDGRYVLRATGEDLQSSNAPEFEIMPPVAPEAREPRMQRDLLRRIAELSGGRYIEMKDIRSLPDLIGAETRLAAVRMEKELWDLPAVFVLLVILAGAEWFVRRRSNLV